LGRFRLFDRRIDSRAAIFQSSLRSVFHGSSDYWLYYGGFQPSITSTWTDTAFPAYHFAIS
jgi:hypothetical protein